MNANTYHQVSADEFTAFLNDYDYAEADVSGVHERVFDLATAADGIVVRVFSTLDDRKNGGDARDAGRDAIRALAWSETADAPLAQATRTHRIKTWAENLAPKVDDLMARAESGEFDDRTPDATLAGLVPVEDGEDAVVVEDLVDTRYGVKAVLATPYEAKDAIKALPWGETHRAWDADRKRWTVDASGLPFVAEDLAESGYPLRRPAMDEDENEDDSFSVSAVLAATAHEVGDRVTVTYTAKNTGSELTKEGEVRAMEDDRLVFVRDDGQFMYVDDNGLFTSGSAYPFVGEVVAVEFAVAPLAA